MPFRVTHTRAWRGQGSSGANANADKLTCVLNDGSEQCSFKKYSRNRRTCSNRQGKFRLSVYVYASPLMGNTHNYWKNNQDLFGPIPVGAKPQDQMTLCWQHARNLTGLQLAKDTRLGGIAGLKTTRLIPAGSVIAAYSPLETLTESMAERLYGSDNAGPFTNSTTDGSKILDGLCYRDLGDYANDARSRPSPSDLPDPNAAIEDFDTGLWMTTEKDRRGNRTRLHRPLIQHFGLSEDALRTTKRTKDSVEQEFLSKLSEAQRKDYRECMRSLAGAAGKHLKVIVATRDIRPGEFITVDYGELYWQNHWRNSQTANNPYKTTPVTTMGIYPNFQTNHRRMIIGGNGAKRKSVNVMGYSAQSSQQRKQKNRTTAKTK